MADTPEAFRAKTDAMFAAAEKHIRSVGVAFITNVAADLIEHTPGPNLQLPETDYIATGQLRDAWNWSLTPANEAFRWNDGGIYDDYGARAFEVIQEQLYDMAALPAISYLQNDVAYGFIVHEGIGRMPYPRPWRDEVVGRMEEHAAAAIAEVSGRG